MKDRAGSFGLLWMRLIMGFGIATHGYDKLINGKMHEFASTVERLGFPQPMLFALAAALSEFLGGICVALGLGTRIAAGFIFITMSVAMFIAQASQPLAAKELAGLYWAIAGALICTGPGMWSVDEWPKGGR